MSKNLILLGGGGHCAAVIDVIEKAGTFRVSHILDVESKVGSTLLSYTISGTEDDLPQLLQQTPYCLVTVGQVQSAQVRVRLYNKLKSLGAQLAVVISPLAYVSPRARLGEGTVVMHQACVNAGAQLGINNIINTQALVEHGVQTGAHCHLATASATNGDCRLGSEVMIGSKATLRQGVEVCDRVVVGMGSIVLKNITTSGNYAGVPARRIG